MSGTDGVSLVGASAVISFGCCKGAASNGDTNGVLAGSVTIFWAIAGSSTTFFEAFCTSVLLFSAPPWMRSRAACRNLAPASGPGAGAGGVGVVAAGVTAGVAAGVGAADDFFSEDRSIGLPFLSYDTGTLEKGAGGVSRSFTQKTCATRKLTVITSAFLGRGAGTATGLAPLSGG